VRAHDSVGPTRHSAHDSLAPQCSNSKCSKKLGVVSLGVVSLGVVSLGVVLLGVVLLGVVSLGVVSLDRAGNHATLNDGELSTPDGKKRDDSGSDGSQDLACLCVGLDSWDRASAHLSAHAEAAASDRVAHG
jgi:hypothetical protein